MWISMRQEMTGFWDGSGISWTTGKQSAPRQDRYHTNTSSLNFYRPDALPDAQATKSVKAPKALNHKINETIATSNIAHAIASQRVVADRKGTCSSSYRYTERPF